MRRAVALCLALAIIPRALAGQGEVRVLTPVADSSVYEGTAATNSGSATTLRVRVKTGQSYRSFLRFDLGSAAGTVRSARLRLFCTDASTSGGQLHALPDSGWSEAGITWANQPALTPAFASIGAVSTNRWVELDVTAALGGNAIQVFALAGGSSNAAYYSSREGSNPPQLVLELPPVPPVAAFSATPLSGSAPLTVSFSDLSSGPPTSWLWTFGDGGTSTAKNPTHVYSEVGTYTVRLDVTGEAGSDSLTRTDYVSVSTPPPTQTFQPTADARVSLGNPTRNYGADTTLRVRSGNDQSYLRFEPTGISGSVTSALLRLFVTDASNVGGSVFATSSGWSETTITWSNKPATIGGALASVGNAAVGTWVVFDVTAAVTGPGPVSFAIQSSSSNSCYYSSREGANPPQLVVTSGGPVTPPVAGFSAVPLSGTAPLSVVFSDLSSGATGWSWTFGDGATSSTKNPTHVYSQAGTYTVRLDVSGPGGSDSLTRSDYVSVSAPPAPVADFSGTPLSGVVPLTVSFSDLSSGASSWSWTFGDGGTSSTKNPTHVYAQAGTYTVRLDVTGPGGSGTLTRSDYVSVSAPPAPVADFGGTPLSGVAPLTVSFSDLSGGSPTSWLWTFGDGATSSARNPTHVYSQAGAYTVRLDVTGPGGSDSFTRTDYVSVSAPPAPVADFAGTPLSGVAPLTVSFSDLSSGSPTSWLWTFGDGATSSARNPTHVYAQAGTYTVRLDVTGPGGSGTLTRSDYVSASAAPPVASFSGTPVSGPAPLTVSFSDLSSGAPASWLWSFGDGASSVQQSPAHTYTDPGTYSVSLTVTGPAGTDTHTSAGLVRVLEPGAGIWTSALELSALPMSGPAWNSMLAEANLPTGIPIVGAQGDDTDLRVLAKALVFARTGDQRYRQDVIAACVAAIGTEVGGRTLDLGRNLIGYVVSAELVGLPSQEDALFRDWLRQCLTVVLDGRTLISTHEERPNNWGTAAGASRMAVALYLGDTTQLERCAQVFHGWLGDRSAYAGFDFGDDLTWQADPLHPVALNPLGATRDGHSIDGVLPDDQRRSGSFFWPPPAENYVWEALQGALVQAVILHRAGYAVWQWEDQALLRAVRWLHEQCDFPAVGDDEWLPHIVNHYYGTSFPAPVPANPGKNMGWTDWTHRP